MNTKHTLHSIPQTPQGAALYIHWPFCKKKCPYCDFNSHVREQVDQEKWLAAYLDELRYWRQASTAEQITSIFFGGGTPSLMPVATVEAILNEVQKLWQVEEDCEITLEANPTSVEAEKFQGIRSAGVNRVSLGVQSFNDASLKFLGREHTAREAKKSIELAARIFPRYSFDLIYALPDQTPAAWEQELKAALPLARGHLSLYQLTIEPNTAFHHAHHTAKQFDLPDDVRAEELYQMTQDIMEAAGLPAYEISNHASAGNESRHNLTYWRGGHYIGIGPGAHGRVPVTLPYIPPASGGDVREGTRAISNLKSPECWLDGGTRLEASTLLTDTERMEEKILMGLRLLHEGVDLAQFTQAERAAFDARIADGRLARLIKEGFVMQHHEHLHVTRKGQLVLNAVIAELLK